VQCGVVVLIEKVHASVVPDECRSRQEVVASH